MLCNFYNGKTKLLTIPDYFNDLIINIPNDTQYIFFYKSSLYNKPFDKSFKFYPIKEIVLGNIFSQSICNLPHTLTHLTFGNSFNKSIEKLPDSILYLSFGHSFNKSIEKLPKSLALLFFGNCFDKYTYSRTKFYIGQIFKKFNWYTCANSYSYFPTSLIQINFGDFFNHPLRFPPNHLITLTHLSFGYLFNQNLDDLNNLPNLNYLILGASFNKSLINLPNFITSITFGTCYNRPIIFSPNIYNSYSLTNIKFGNFLQNLLSAIILKEENLMLHQLSGKRIASSFSKEVNNIIELPDAHRMVQ